MSAPEPRIDFAAIEFPSDRLSFEVLRRKFPELIDSSPTVTFFELPEGNPVYHTENLTNLLQGEREVALMAFSAALGREWTPGLFTAEEVKQYLAEDYVRYGVASGEQHAAQLIRGIETMAMDQARRHVKSR
jgi:hypothetical protein